MGHGEGCWLELSHTDLKHTHGRHLCLHLGKINAELGTPRLQLKERWEPRSNKGLSIYRGSGFSPAKNTYDKIHAA